MRIQELSNEIYKMKEQMKSKSEILFKELFEEKLKNWLIKDQNGVVVGYEVDDTSEENYDYLDLQEKIDELIEILKWELLDWRIFPYEEEEISLERGGLVVNIKNELFHIEFFLKNLFK